VECTFIGGLVLVDLLGMNFVDSLGGYGGRVNVDNVERGGGTFFSLSLRYLEVPN
jgi:hypothetical protein